MNPKPFRTVPCFVTILMLLFAIALPPGWADTTVNGGIWVDTTWSQAGSPYIVTSNITVQGTDGTDGVTTLTIEPGTTILFSWNTRLSVGAGSGSPGALVAQGTAANPITFSSNKASPAPGDWYGIVFYATTDNASTTMDHCSVQYAGYGMGQIYINNAAPTLSNCTLNSSSKYDLYYSGTVGGTVSGCTFNSGIYLLATSSVDFNGNTFNYNNSYPIKSYADNVHSLVNGNTFANLDAASYLEVSSLSLTKDATWTATIPYFMNSSMSIQGTDGADGITTLTIEPGVTIRFNQNTQLIVGASSGDPGALSAQGTAAEPITFTSNQPSPAPGNWYGIRFLATTNDAGTVLDHCLVQYAGYGNQGQIYTKNAAPALNNCTLSNSSNYDLYYYNTVGGTVSGCTFNSGIYLLATSTVDFNGNTFNYNNSYPIKSYADNVHSLVNGNTFANLDAASYLEVSSGNVARDATWTAAIPYVLNSSMTIQGTDGADGVTTLTIEPGGGFAIQRQYTVQYWRKLRRPGSTLGSGHGRRTHHLHLQSVRPGTRQLVRYQVFSHNRRCKFGLEPLPGRVRRLWQSGNGIPSWGQTFDRLFDIQAKLARRYLCLRHKQQQCQYNLQQL